MTLFLNKRTLTDDPTGWHILDHRGLCFCPVVTRLWLYSQRSSYHCSAITSDLTCGACFLLFYRMTLTFILSQNEKFLLLRKAIKFCLTSHSKYEYCMQLTNHNVEKCSLHKHKFSICPFLQLWKRLKLCFP